MNRLARSIAASLSTTSSSSQFPLATSQRLFQILPPQPLSLNTAADFPTPRTFSSNTQNGGSDAPIDHWLDRFTGLRTWLEDANRRWWIQGLVQARCKEHHQLEGRESFLRDAVQTEFSRLMDKHSELITDSRSRVHLGVACLVLSTHKALLPFLRDEVLVLDIIRDHMGQHTHKALVFLMRVTGWVQRDPYKALVGRLRGLKIDYGRSFDTNLIIGDTASSLTIKSCYYHQLFEQEEQPQLTACCCCSQDRFWLEAVPRKGVVSGLASSIARGDPSCCYYVEKTRIK